VNVFVRNTSRYPTDEIDRLVRFGTSEIDMRRVCVNVKNSWRYGCGGSAYEGVPEISNAPPKSEYLVTIRLGPPEMFPTTLPSKKRSPSRVIMCWREAVVAMAAHEAKHIEQYRLGLPRSEVECECFEAAMLDRYRLSLNAVRVSPPVK
jgi:hypothetical protein